MSNKKTKRIEVSQTRPYNSIVGVRIDNSTAYSIRQHKSAINKIKNQAKKDVKQHKLLIKQARISAELRTC